MSQCCTSTSEEESMSTPSVLGPLPPMLLRMVMPSTVTFCEIADVDRPEAGALQLQTLEIHVVGLVDLDEARPLAVVVRGPAQALGLVVFARGRFQ